MAEKLQFQIEFELAQQALREIRAQLKRQLSNIQATIEPRVQRAVTRGTQSQISNVSGEISQEVERLQKTQAAALQKLNSAQERLSVATQRAAQITEAGANITDQERRELITLNRSVGQLKRSVRESFDEFVNLNPVIGNLKAAIQESVGAFTNLELGQESELNNLFIELSASVNSASDEFQKIITGGRALNVNTVLDRFGSRIERDVLPAFESLGLTAQQQEGFVRQAISSLAQKIEDAGFTLPEGEFDVLGTESRNLSAQERSLNSAVQRLRNVTRTRVRTIEDGIAREREGRAVGDASVRIQEQASLATNELAQSFRDRARAIRLLSFDEILSPRLVEFANRLEKSATDLQLASRPIIAVGERASELAIRFGSVTREVAEGLFPRATRKQLITASDSLRQSIAENEGNIDKGVEAFVASLAGLETTEENVKKTLGLLDAALKKEAAATIDLANSEKQRADSLRGQASKSLQQTARLDLSSAQAEITRSAKDLVRDLRGAGKEAAQLRDDGTFSNFQQQLGAVQARFFAALDPGQLSFLQSTGVNIDSIIRDALTKVTQNFTSEFNRETGRITKILLDEATRGARELARGLGRAGQEAGDLLDPDFLEKSIGQITSEFPNLTEQIVEDIVRPLRRQIEKAAESRQRTDSQIQSIRDKQRDAQEELLRRINNAFQAQELEGALGGGALESAGRSLANSFSNAAGRIQNAFSLSEKQAIQDAQERKEVNSLVIQAHNAEIAAIEGEIDAVRSQESTNENFARNLRVAARALESRNNSIIQELSELEGAIQRAELGFEGFDNLASLRQRQQELARQQVTTQQQLLNVQLDEARALSEAEQQSSSLVQKQNIILSLQSDIINAEQNLASATQEAADIQNTRNQRISTGTDNRVGGQGPLQSFDIQSLQDFGQKLDIASQERFVKILKEEDTNLAKVNTQLKAHQGNINKSSALTEKLTQNLTSGQKAAFQFGFAAASAADRLLAWASPAAFIFSAISSLREAVQTIIRIDETVSRIAFFNPDTLDRAAAGVRGLGDSLGDVATGADSLEGSFTRLNNVTEQYIALTRAAAQTQTILLERSRQTGIEVERLAEIVLIAGRVNREAFSDIGEINPFALAVEGLLRLEGPLGNAEKLTADLNSVLNQFQLEGSSAALVAAQLAEVSQRSAFGVGELAEGLTRVGGAFSAVQGATVAESLEFLSAASNAAQTSVSRVGTALRQLSIGVASSADEVREFSGLQIVDEDKQLKGPRALVDILKVINSFQGEQAAIDFISEFTDERNASIILGLARNVDNLSESFNNLGDEAEREANQIQTLRRFFAQQETQTRTVSAEINKLRASLEGLVSDSGAVGFFADIIRATTGFLNLINGVTTGVGGLAPIFAATFGLLIPTLRQVTRGFVAGVLPSQKLVEVQRDLVVNLLEEGNLLKAANLARAEGLLTEEQAVSFRTRTVNATTALAVQERELRNIKVQIATLEQNAPNNARQLNNLKAQEAALDAEILALKRQESAVQKDIKTQVIASTRAGGLFSPRAASRFGTAITAALIAGGITAAPLIGKSIGGETGKQVESAIQGAISAGAIGALFGPIGAGLGAIVGILGSIFIQQSRIAEQAEKEKQIRGDINKIIEDERRLAASRDEVKIANAGKIADRNSRQVLLTKELEDLDIRIRALGEARAKEEGLVVQRKESQIQLNTILAQQKDLENRQLEEQIRFEERISDVKRDQNILQRTGELLQKAQLASLDATRVITPVIEARINAKADLRQIDIEKEFIKRQISEIDVRILAVREERDAAQTIKKLERDRLSLKNKEVDIEFDLLAKRQEIAEDALAAARKVADSETERFKNITNAANETIKNLVDSQLRVVELIGQEADKFEEIFELQEEAVETRERSTRGGAVRDITDLNIRQQRNIIQRRNQIILEGARQAGQLLRRQFEELGAVPSLQDLVESADALKGQIDSTGGTFGRFRDGLDRSTKLQLDQVSATRELFDIQRNQTLSSINLQRTALQQESEVARRRIGLIEDELEVLQRRIDREAEIGEKLISAPDEFLKETRRIFEASNVLRAARVNSANVESALLDVIQRITRVTGIEGLQPILEGLQAAETRDQSLIEGVLPGQLTSLFTRLVANPNARLQEQQISEQQKLIGEIGGLVTSIQGNNSELIELIRTEQEIETLLRREETPKAQLAELKKNVAASRSAAISALVNAQDSRIGLENVGSRIGTLRASFDEKILQVTQGDEAIVSAISNVENILAEIRDADEGVTRNREAVQGIREEIQGLRGGQVPEASAEAFEASLAIARRAAEQSDRELRKEFREISNALTRFNELQRQIRDANREFGTSLQRGTAFFGAVTQPEIRTVTDRSLQELGVVVELTPAANLELTRVLPKFEELSAAVDASNASFSNFRENFTTEFIRNRLEGLEGSLEKFTGSVSTTSENINRAVKDKIDTQTSNAVSTDATNRLLGSSTELQEAARLLGLSANVQNAAAVETSRAAEQTSRAAEAVRQTGVGATTGVALDTRAAADVINAQGGRGAIETAQEQSLTQSLANVLNDPLARQIAAMERIVEVNERGLVGRLDTEALAIAKENLAELKNQFSLQQGDVERLERIRQELEERGSGNTAIAAGIDHLFQPTQQTADAVEKQAEETGKKFVEANKPIADATVRNAASLEQLRTEMANLFSATSSLREEQATQHQQNLEQRQQLSTQQTGKLQIDEASREDFVNLFTDKFNEACQQWVLQFVGAINENPLTVGAAPIELELNASVQTEVTGEEFITQLTEALVGTGLEDKTELIITALAPLLQLELDRSGNITQSGEEVISLGGRTSGTTTNR